MTDTSEGEKHAWSWEEAFGWLQDSGDEQGGNSGKAHKEENERREKSRRLNN